MNKYNDAFIKLMHEADKEWNSPVPTLLAAIDRFLHNDVSNEVLEEAVINAAELIRD